MEEHGICATADPRVSEGWDGWDGKGRGCGVRRGGNGMEWVKGGNGNGWR